MAAPGRKIISRFLIAGLLAFAASSHAKTWVFSLNEGKTRSADISLDAYLSYAGFNTSLVNQKPEVLDVEAEQGMYSYMLMNFHKPQTLRLEISTNPFPLLGVYLKSEQPQWYSDGGDVTAATGIIRAVSAGFPDPGALSLFLGNKAFLGDYSNGKILGVFYGGLLINYGNFHILNNNMYQDHWFEGELKLKGSAIGEKSDFTTSYRCGGKYHFHEDIKGTIFISIKRDRTDRDYTGWSLVKNSNIELRFDLAPVEFLPAKFTVVAGKKIPFSQGKYVFALSLGAEWASANGYSQEFYQQSLLPGEQGTTVTSKWNFIFRPNVTF